MGTGMGDLLFAETHGQAHHCLDWILQELRNYPKTGEALLPTAIRSPVVRERNGTCKVLKEWGE